MNTEQQEQQPKSGQGISNLDANEIIEDSTSNFRVLSEPDFPRNSLLSRKNVDPRTSVNFLLNHTQDMSPNSAIFPREPISKNFYASNDFCISNSPVSSTLPPVPPLHLHPNSSVAVSDNQPLPPIIDQHSPLAALNSSPELLTVHDPLKEPADGSDLRKGATLHAVANNRSQIESLELLCAVAATKKNAELKDDEESINTADDESESLESVSINDLTDPNPLMPSVKKSKAGKVKILNYNDNDQDGIAASMIAEMHEFSGESNSEDDDEPLESLIKRHKVGIRPKPEKISRPEHQFHYHGELYISRKLVPKRTRKEVDHYSSDLKTLKKKAYQEQKAVSAVVTPTLPSGYQKYIVQKDGGYYSPNFDTSEDFKRRRCWDLTELRYDNEIWYLKDDMDYRILPFFSPEESRPTKANREFWLVTVLENCLNQDYLHIMIQRGLIQWVVGAIDTTTKDSDRMILLLILRMAASCYNYADLLVYGCERIYAFLFDVLKSSNDHFDNVVFRRKLMDSRAYNYFLTVAWLAHLRPILPSARYRSFDEEAKYRLLRDTIMTRYTPLLNGSIKSYQDFFPPLLASQHAKLTAHDMAIEIFVDMAKFCLVDRFSENIMSVRWAKLFSNYLSKDHTSLLSLQLTDVLHKSPEVGIKLVDPFIVGIDCFVCLDWVLTQVLEREYFESTSSEMPFVPFKYLKACIDTLLSMSASINEDLLGDEQHSNNTFLSFVLSGKPISKLVQYALIAPRLHEEWYRNLYDNVWELIHRLNYSFPYQLRTLIDIATHDEDEDDVPLQLRGHAALYVATSTIYSSRPKLTRVEMLKVRHSLQLFAEHTHCTGTRVNLLDLALQLSIYLEPRNYGITSSMTHDGEVQFVAYDFESDNEPDRSSVFTDCRKIYISSAKLFEEDKIVEVKRALPSFIANDRGASSSLASNKAGLR